MTATATEYTLDAQVREERGKEKSKKLRAKGLIPVVVYGAGGESVSLTVDGHDFSNFAHKTHGEAVMVKLNYDGKTDSVFVKDIQRDPVSEKILHADLLRVDLLKKITLTVPVTQVGSTPAGVREGGLLEQLAHEVEVEALPDKIPGHIEVDLSDLEGGHSIHVSDLPELDGVAYLSDPDMALFTVIDKDRAERAAAEADAAAEDLVEEPEVVGADEGEEQAEEEKSED